MVDLYFGPIAEKGIFTGKTHFGQQLVMQVVFGDKNLVIEGHQKVIFFLGASWI